MPDDLILKFFENDLTEAEETALAESLLSSTEEALRFGEKARSVYLSFGLPEPHWPGSGGGVSQGPGQGTPPAGHGGAHSLLQHFTHISHLVVKHWVISSAIATSVTTGVVIVHQAVLKAKSSPAPVQAPVVVPSPIPSPAATAKPQVLIPASKPAIVPLTPALTVSNASPLGELTPISLDNSPHRTYSNLAVVVRRPSSGQVAIRVFNAVGDQVVLLYQGLLQSGSWVFDWDGKTQQGTVAGPGSYEIQVESGPVTQKKTVVIR